jgi:hypothetical protein
MCRVTDGVVCGAEAVALMTTVMAWDFRRARGLAPAASFGFFTTPPQDTNATPPLRPPASWRPHLTDSRLQQWLLGVLRAYGRAHAGACGVALGANARAFLIQLCALQGDVLRRQTVRSEAASAQAEEHPVAIRARHTEFCLQGILAVRSLARPRVATLHVSHSARVSSMSLRHAQGCVCCPGVAPHHLDG